MIVSQSLLSLVQKNFFMKHKPSLGLVITWEKVGGAVLNECDDGTGNDSLYLISIG
jgi:hypothetical protein